MSSRESQAARDADAKVGVGDHTPHSLGRCRVSQCRRRIVTVESGYQVPFCSEHWTQLSRLSRIALAAVAPASIFDVDAAAIGARAVKRALVELGGKS